MESSTAHARHGSSASSGSHHQLSPELSPRALPPSAAKHRATTSSSSSQHHRRQNHSSSKLPAFRFADLKESGVLPSLLHQHHIPPSPVSPPDFDRQPKFETQSAAPPSTRTTTRSQNNCDDPVSPKDPSLTSRTPARNTTNTTTSAPEAPPLTDTSSLTSPTESAETIRPLPARAPASSDSASASRLHSREGSPGDASPQESAPGQIGLLLPRTVQRTTSTDDKKTPVKRPPVSYKPPVGSNTSGGTASIPPIRSFRSSGDRRSLLLDMNSRSPRYHDGSDYFDENDGDTTLRATKGLTGDDALRTPPAMVEDRTDSDDTGDVFLRIAREATSPRRAADFGENESVISRVSRSTRRPLSLAVSHQPAAPPPMSRRLSDQETARLRGYGNEQSVDRNIPPLSHRGLYRDRLSDDARSRGASTPLRGTPLTPRTLTYQDLPPEPNSASSRRRQSSIDAGSALPSRMSSLKQSSANHNHPRAYNPSPLAPRPTESQKHDAPPGDASHGVEGTDSTASTAAPSTVWDELDDLKSRINRLELTGKLPPSSSAAISRASEERPPTAHTNATTMSASPKRGSGSVVHAVDPASGQPKEGHPLLYSALAKSKDFLAPEVYSALETTAEDALALSSMMGTAGQPGPISSGTSNAGGGAVTDRQLRRKADGICRSLTELCLALSEGVAQAKPQQRPSPSQEDAPYTSPMSTKFSGVASQRRPSVHADRILAQTTSPRSASRFDDSRRNPLMTSALPSPRYSSTTPATPTDGAAPGRRTSLLLSRTRRAGTEELDDVRRTSMLRTTRAGTEEPDDSRRTSLLRTRRAGTEEPEDLSDRRRPLLRGRSGTIGDEEAEVRFRTPSRAMTEISVARPANRENNGQLPTPGTKESDLLASAMPRRRLAGPGLNTRLSQSTAASAIATPSRRYFDRATPTRESINPIDKAAEDQAQRSRQISLSRAGSLGKRADRRSMIATPSASYR
ncbi:hypothetical protein GGR56DRAFT_627843 [Xylariaceae sp. FL0804]|nr:hypothetical protein GGR56DRAFT_627843 [Xylariaceae sp. FL0804]